MAETPHTTTSSRPRSRRDADPTLDTEGVPFGAYDTLDEDPSVAPPPPGLAITRHLVDVPPPVKRRRADLPRPAPAADAPIFRTAPRERSRRLIDTLDATAPSAPPVHQAPATPSPHVAFLTVALVIGVLILTL